MFISYWGLAGIGLVFYLFGWLVGRAKNPTQLSEAAQVELRKYEIDRQAECFRHSIDQSIHEKNQEK